MLHACARNYAANLNRHPTTGLIADFLAYKEGDTSYTYLDPPGKVLEKWPGDGQFCYNACR